MMGMSKNDIARIITELAPLLTGGRVQKIYQATEREVTLVIRSSRTYMLLFSLDPEFCRVHLVTEKRKNPQNPLSFCQFLRKYLTGMAISSIRQAIDDRVVSIELRRGREAEFYIVAELFGRNSNIFLTDSVGRVLSKLIRSGKDEREKIEHFLPVLETETGSPSAFMKHDQDVPRANIEAEETYRGKEERRGSETLRTSVVTGLRKKAGKLAIRRRKMEGDLNSVLKWKSYLRNGELIKNNFHLLKKGSSEVELRAYGSGERYLVPLDPSLTPLQNMNSYFRRYKKSVRGFEKITDLLKEIESETLHIEEKIKAVENLTHEKLLSKYKAPQRILAEKAPARKKNKTSKPFNFTSIEGLSILVGKSDTQNDEITFKVAKGNDLWFHVRDSGGAHVVLQTAKKSVPTQESILDAASLALFYSKLKSEERGEVLYTHRKHLKKPGGEKPGRVTYTQDKTIFIHLESTRIRRLLDSRSD